MNVNRWLRQVIRHALEAADNTADPTPAPAIILPTRDLHKKAEAENKYARHIEETGSQRISGRMHSEPRSLKATHAQTAQRKPAFKD